MFARSFFLMCASALVLIANVTNVEFTFSPFTGEHLKADRVDIVAGKLRVLLNNVPIAEKIVEAAKAPVMFEDRQVGGPIWITAQSFGPTLRKKGNLLRIEFEPANAKAPYTTQLRWAFVSDGITETASAGKHTSTNMMGEGKEEKSVTGKVVLEKGFDADFAPDRPWHKYPEVTSLSDADRLSLTALLQKRLAAYQPASADAYKFIDADPRVDGAELRKRKCVEKAFATGLRVKGPAAGHLEIVLTGKQEVVLRAKEGPLYNPVDESIFGKIKDQSIMRCLIPVMEVLFPERLIAVKDPSGVWEEAR